MERIASFSNTNSLLQQSMRLQSNYAKAQSAISSGLKSPTYDGLAGSTQTLLSLENSIATTTQFKANANNLSSRLEAMYQAVGGMSDQLASSLQTLTLAMGGDQLTDSEISAYMQSALEQVTSLLNTQMADNYLFSGTATQTMPVDISALPAQSVPSAADTAYYAGDSSILSLQIAASQTVKYGITADNSSFEQMIRGLKLAMDHPSDNNAISEAFGLLQNATKGLAAMQTQISAQSNMVNDRIMQHDVYLETAGNMADAIRNADTAALTVAVSSIEAQLEASYSVMTKLISLKLTDFLR